MGYLAAAFAALWVLVTVYLVLMSLRQRKLEVELMGLEEALRERQAADNRR